MRHFRTVLVLLTFVLASGDFFRLIRDEVADWHGFVQLPVLFMGLTFSLFAGAITAHALLSLIQGTSFLTDLVQEEPAYYEHG